MISIVLSPLGLPLEVALVLLLAVDPITDPALTLVNVQTNCAACSLIQGRTGNSNAIDPVGR
jgi:proton glutamate symport protein